MPRLILPILACGLAALLIGCVPATSTPTPTLALTPTPTSTPACTPDPDSLVCGDETMTPIAGGTDPSSAAAADAAVTITAEALGVEPSQVSVVSVEAVDWPDASLGCPQPDMMYAQVITPGYRVTVEVDGTDYQVHLDAQGQGTVCPPIE